MFGRNKGKSIDDMTTEEIEKYLESRKASEQSDQTLKDRVDESVAMDEKDTGTDDEQTAADRVDEALGEDAETDKPEDEGKPDEAEPAADGTTESEPVAEPSEPGDSTPPDDDWRSRIEQKLDTLKAELDGIRRTPQAADTKTADKLTELENKFN